MKTEYQYIIAAFLTGVLGPIIVLLVKNYLARRRVSSDMLTDSIEVSSIITGSIEDIREEFLADRIWITQFHNGGHFYPTGKSIAKFSVLYESVNVGASSIQTLFQNIPVNLFSKSMSQLLKFGTIAIPDYKDETIATYGLKYTAEDSGCKSGYLFANKTIDGKFIGVLGLDYITKKTNLNNIQLNALRAHAASIGGVLMTHLRA